MSRALLLLPVVLAVVSIYFLVSADGASNEVEDLLNSSGRIMATLSFSHVLSDCPTCPPPVITEYAPPDRIKLSNSKGHDDWPYAMFANQKPYVSQEGTRWRESLGLPSWSLLLRDPRFLLTVLDSPSLDGSEEVQGRAASIVSGKFEYDLYVERAPPAMLPANPEEDFSGFREVFDGATLSFWIDNRDFRVLQMELTLPDLGSQRMTFDYVREVSIPDDFESMPADQAWRLGQEGEPAGLLLLKVIGEYQTLNRQCPPSLDAEVLATVLGDEAWPTNVFTGEHMRNERDRPGDFLYLVKNGGNHCEFTLHGWDGAQVYYDSERFGPISQPGLR